jgi:hypothetical protein
VPSLLRFGGHRKGPAETERIDGAKVPSVSAVHLVEGDRGGWWTAMGLTRCRQTGSVTDVCEKGPAGQTGPVCDSAVHLWPWWTAMGSTRRPRDGSWRTVLKVFVLGPLWTQYTTLAALEQ